MPENYKVQEHLECCHNCVHNDTDGNDVFLCTLTMEEVSPVGICGEVTLDFSD